ncbi:putative signal transducing protein [Anaerovorax odorimutans]|uniref:putative signal transducing protein n=1 Tax=Anaerovorax odorimutans TaxID=109327 RepID=UPI0004093389|nr:DUF2007 domain-containing protein [Anaerovorax odorimutans]
MFGNKEKKEWRDGVYLCTVKNSFEADILESKLRGEGIPTIKKYKGAGNFLEIFMGSNTTFPIDLYVPEEALEDAKNIIVAVPLSEGEAVDFDELTEEELDELIGEEETDEEDK